MAIDILLVNPVFLSQNKAESELMNPYFPLGLLYLAAYIRDRGFRVEIFDGTFSTGPEAFEAALEEHQPQVVGITVVKPNRQMALKLASLAHAQGAKVILGGPDPTTTPETYLAAPEVDLVVHHEGELTIIDLLQKIKAQEDYSEQVRLNMKDLSAQLIQLEIPNSEIDDLGNIQIEVDDFTNCGLRLRYFEG